MFFFLHCFNIFCFVCFSRSCYGSCNLSPFICSSADSCSCSLLWFSVFLFFITLLQFPDRNFFIYLFLFSQTLHNLTYSSNSLIAILILLLSFCLPSLFFLLLTFYSFFILFLSLCFPHISPILSSSFSSRINFLYILLFSSFNFPVFHFFPPSVPPKQIPLSYLFSNILLTLQFFLLFHPVHLHLQLPFFFLPSLPNTPPYLITQLIFL